MAAICPALRRGMARMRAGLSLTFDSLNDGVRGAWRPGKRLACRLAGVDGRCGAYVAM